MSDCLRRSPQRLSSYLACGGWQIRVVASDVPTYGGWSGTLEIYWQVHMPFAKALHKFTLIQRPWENIL